MIINKKQLLEKIHNAKQQVRVLGVLPFDIRWDDFKQSWLEKIDNGQLKVEIICEPITSVAKQSVISSDKKISGESRSYEFGSFRNILASPEINLRKYLVDNKCRNIEPYDDMYKEVGNDYKQLFSLRTCYLPFDIPVINIDDEYFITYRLSKFNNSDKFEKIDEGHDWFEEFSLYFYNYFDNQFGARRFSTEVTSKGNRLEVIQAFDEDRRVIGELPRSSFFFTKHVKLVVWAMVFTRDGKILLHKRKENAKDNQGMWDKSVGGHVDVNDIDTVKAVARELGEELYITEASDQGGHGNINFVEVNTDKLIFLGEWLPERRYTMPFKDINSRKDEYYYFRTNYPFSLVARGSDRHLPNGDVKEVTVFADVYMCVAGENFDISRLKNSDYVLLEPYEIKDAYNEGEISYFKNGQIVTEKMKISPDLKSILRTSMWDDFTSFSDFVKETYSEV